MQSREPRGFACQTPWTPVTTPSPPPTGGGVTSPAGTSPVGGRLGDLKQALTPAAVRRRRLAPAAETPAGAAAAAARPAAAPGRPAAAVPRAAPRPSASR